mmetsp:Transcript_570/g.2369  ORF Transcript_570/g.2369 Transcript_570/m.2369 type:complete len:205 (+) Transcript_570:982-1596(+)
MCKPHPRPLRAAPSPRGRADGSGGSTSAAAPRRSKARRGPRGRPRKYRNPRNLDLDFVSAPPPLQRMSSKTLEGPIQALPRRRSAVVCPPPHCPAPAWRQRPHRGRQRSPLQGPARGGSARPGTRGLRNPIRGEHMQRRHADASSCWPRKPRPSQPPLPQFASTSHAVLRGRRRHCGAISMHQGDLSEGRPPLAPVSAAALAGQ